MICQPVGIARKTIWINILNPLNMRKLSQDLKLLLRSEGMTVTTTTSPNILLLQIHARGIKGHYYVVKICQTQGQVLLESGIISAKQELEWAGVEGGLGAISDIVLHNKWITLLSTAFAGVDISSVLGSYEEEEKILSQIQQIILSYQQQQVTQAIPINATRKQFKYCPNCGYELKGSPNYCPNCGYKLK